MKAIFIAYDQAYGDEIVELLDSMGQRGFTRWTDIQGRGGVDGTPHYGSHAWPAQNQAIMTFVPDELEQSLMDALRDKDAKYPNLGLRAFSWTIGKMV